MNRLFLLSVLAISLASVKGGSDCYAKLSAAQIAFNGQLGINATLNWYNADSLRSVIYSHYMSAPPTGLRTVCSAAQTFKVSLGKDYDRCMRPVELMRNDDGTANVGRTDAYNYFSAMTGFDFTCGVGFGVFVNDAAQCIPNTYTTKYEALAQCRYNFNYELQNGDRKMLCVYVVNLMTCYSQVFGTCGDMGKFYGCEFARTPLIFNYPSCNEAATNCMVNNYFH